MKNTFSDDLGAPCTGRLKTAYRYLRISSHLTLTSLFNCNMAEPKDS